jgi:hypothetical protein
MTINAMMRATVNAPRRSSDRDVIMFLASMISRMPPSRLRAIRSVQRDYFDPPIGEGNAGVGKYG